VSSNPESDSSHPDRNRALFARLRVSHAITRCHFSCSLVFGMPRTDPARKQKYDNARSALTFYLFTNRLLPPSPSVQPFSISCINHFIDLHTLYIPLTFKASRPLPHLAMGPTVPQDGQTVAFVDQTASGNVSRQVFPSRLPLHQSLNATLQAPRSTYWPFLMLT
jgi:hypothetical protein